MLHPEAKFYVFMTDSIAIYLILTYVFVAAINKTNPGAISPDAPTVQFFAENSPHFLHHSHSDCLTVSFAFSAQYFHLSRMHVELFGSKKKNSSNKVSEIQGWNSKFAKCIQSYWDVSKPKADAEEIEKKVTSKKNKIIWTISVKRTNKIITWIFVSCNCGMVQWTCQKKKNERTASIK